MIRLMIVDDEPIIREGMMTIIDWESLGVIVVGTVGNGRDGLARAMVEKPDIVITDIRMPVVDGIKFSEELHAKLPKTRIVFLTGYNDFEYTRHAVRIGAADYLLKPVNTEELTGLIKKLVNEIIRESREFENRSQRAVLLKENLPLMRSRCIHDFMWGKTEEKRFLERAGFLGIPLMEENLRIVIFCIDYYFQLLANGEREADLLKYALSNVAEELMGRLGNICVCDEGEARLMVLLSSGEDTKEVARSAREVQFYLRKHYGLSVSVGIGKLVSEWGDLKLSYQNADEALEGRMKQGSSQIIAREKSHGSLREEKIFITAEEEAELKNAVTLLDRRKIYDTLEEIFQKYVMEQEVGRKAVEQFCMYLVLIAMREVQRFQLAPEQVLGKNYYFYEEVSKYVTADDLEMWLKDIYSSVLQAVEDRRNSKYKGIVTNGIAYAQDHVSESIQVADVAKAVYVTPNYFSKIFKEETGENFTDWLNKFRIEMAKKRMEKEPETKIYTIAEECGFSDYKYFAFIFKKYTGYTPTSYRNMIV